MANTTVITSAATTHHRTPKRSITEYEAIKDPTVYARWLRGITSISHIHKTNDVLDPTYKPISTEKVSFDESNKFMHAMLVKTVLYPGGANIVRLCTPDAQLAFTQLSAHSFQGVTGDTLKVNLKNALVALRFNASWGKLDKPFSTTGMSASSIMKKLFS